MAGLNILQNPCDLIKKLGSFDYPQDKFLSPEDLKQGLVNGSLEKKDARVWSYITCSYQSKLLVNAVAIEQRDATTFDKTENEIFFESVYLHCEFMTILRKCLEIVGDENLDPIEERIQDLHKRMETFLKQHYCPAVRSVSEIIDRLDVDLEHLKSLVELFKLKRNDHLPDFVSERLEFNKVYHKKFEAEARHPHCFFFLPIFDKIYTGLFKDKLFDLKNVAASLNFLRSFQKKFPDLFFNYSDLLVIESEMQESYLKRIELSQLAIEAGNLRGFKSLARYALEYYISEPKGKIHLDYEEKYLLILKDIAAKAVLQDETGHHYNDVFYRILFLLATHPALDEDKKNLYKEAFEAGLLSEVQFMLQKQKSTSLMRTYSLLSYYYFYVGDIEKSIEYAKKEAKIGPHQGLDFLYNNHVSKTKDDFCKIISHKGQARVTTVAPRKSIEALKTSVTQEYIYELCLKYGTPTAIYKKVFNILSEEFLKDGSKENKDKTEQIFEALSLLRKIFYDLTDDVKYESKRKYFEVKKLFPETLLKSRKLESREYFLKDFNFEGYIIDPYRNVRYERVLEKSKYAQFFLEDEQNLPLAKHHIVGTVCSGIYRQITTDDKYADFRKSNEYKEYEEQFIALKDLSFLNYNLFPERLPEIFRNLLQLRLEFMSQFESYREGLEQESLKSYQIPAKNVARKPKGKGKGKGRSKSRTTKTFNQKQDARKLDLARQEKEQAEKAQENLTNSQKKLPAQPKSKGKVGRQAGERDPRPNLEIVRAAMLRYAEEDAHIQNVKAFYIEKTSANKKYLALMEDLFDQKSNKKTVLNYNDIPDFVKFIFPNAVIRRETKGTGGGHVMAVGTATFTIHKTNSGQKGHGGSVSQFIKFLKEAYDVVHKAI